MRMCSSQHEFQVSKETGASNNRCSDAIT